MQRLFLASEAKHPESMEKLKKFIGGSFANKQIAYVPTAANGEFYGSWKGGGSIRAALSTGARVKIVELESNHYTNVIKEIMGSDILWLAGGVVSYLLYWINRVELNKALPEMFENGAVVVGSSGGSMVCSKTQYTAQFYIGEEDPELCILLGLGLIDFEIYPHYEDALRDHIEANWKPGQGKLYLLKNGDAITKVGDKIEVLGEERLIEK